MLFTFTTRLCLFFSLALIAALSPSISAQQVNPTDQINWVAATGAGVPSAACTNANYGQPYTDTTANVQYFCTAGGWTASAAAASGAHLHIPYYCATTSGFSICPDSVATTDDAGNFSLTSLVATVNANSVPFPSNNNALMANFNANLPVSSWTNSPTGLFANIEDSVSDSTSNAGVSSQGAYLQVYHNGSGKIDSIGGVNIDLELCGIQACTGSLNWEFGFGGDMESFGTVNAGTAWDASENDGIQGYHMEYEVNGATDYITDIASLTHVALDTGANVNTVAGIHVFNNILPGSGVTLPNLYGIYINSLQGKATNVYGVYSEGTEPSYFGGAITMPAPTFSNITGSVQCLHANTSGVVSGTVADCFANPMTTLGDVIYGGSGGVPTRLAGNTTTTKLYMTETGTGTASAAPAWSALPTVPAVSTGHLGAASCTTGSTSYSTCSSTITVFPAQVDTNYAVSGNGLSPSDARAVLQTCSPASTTTVTCVVVTEGSIAVSFGDISVIAVHY